MANVLLFLAYLGAILLIGLLASAVSNKLKIPHILLFLLIGIALGKAEYNGSQLIFFPELFLTGISILALAMVAFDAASRLKLRNLDYFSLHALWLSIVFLIFNLVFMAFFTTLIFGVKSVFLAFIFAAMISGTDPGAVLAMLKNANHKVFDFLRVEALLNALLAILLPFLILDLKTALEGRIGAGALISQFAPLVQPLIVGAGTGVLIGLIMFKFMKKQYSAVISPLVVIASALLAYAIAESLHGNGVLAVVSMGILFGNAYVKQKFELQEFSAVFSNSLEIVVFVLIGLIVSMPFTIEFFLKSALLFALYLLIRLFSTAFSLRGMDFGLKEKIFVALNAQNGIAVAAVALSLANLGIDGMGTILNLALAFMLYSAILSAFTLRASGFFIGAGIKNKKITHL